MIDSAAGASRYRPCCLSTVGRKEGRTVHMIIYVIVWAGGYDEPSYTCRSTEEKAFEVARTWAAQGRADGDTIDVLAIDTDTEVVTRVGQW